MAAGPTVWSMAAIMARDGSLTFGGGGPTAVALERKMVHERAWISRSTFRLAFALSRLTPGTNMFAFCTALGWQAQGASGAAIALLAASVPCSVVTVAITILLEMWQRYPTAAFAIRVASAISIGLVVGSCWPLVRPHVRGRAWVRTLVFLGGAAGLQLAGVPPLRVLLVAAVAGLLWREPA